jgi:hypothetical protein
MNSETKEPDVDNSRRIKERLDAIYSDEQSSLDENLAQLQIDAINPAS